MVDVCCLCGDVGFSDKLFRCSKCRHRFQHSYCSNYYREDGGLIQVCDWCQCEERNFTARQSGSSPPSSRNNNSKSEARSVYSGERIKQHHGGSSAGKPPSPRPIVRRYKLLKDVMC
ncbi:zinc ion-binding protein [Perilla frutescens var. frutescens]|nr:zinc ion-binding protein [Perilla frutescens var. frutescens]